MNSSETTTDMFDEIDNEILHLVDDLAVMSSKPTSIPSNKSTKVNLQHTLSLKKIKGKKRKVNPAYVPSIRVFKRDIRRKYMEMYNNVINNHDVVLMEKFLREFCTPTCRYLVTVSRPSRPVVNIVDRVGIPDILLGQVQFYIKLPDSIYQMGDAQIHVTYQQPGSYIVSAVKLQGTRLFEMENDAITLLNSTFQNTSSYSTSSHQSTENKSSDDATESSDESDVLSISFSQSAPLTEMRYNDVIDALALLPPSSFDLDSQNDGLIVSEIMPRLQSMRLLQLPSPRDVTAHGLLTMDLDPNHRIETLRFDVHLLRETDHKFT